MILFLTLNILLSDWIAIFKSKETNLQNVYTKKINPTYYFLKDVFGIIKTKFSKNNKAHLTFTCSKSTNEAFKKSEKYFQS